MQHPTLRFYGLLLALFLVPASTLLGQSKEDSLLYLKWTKAFEERKGKLSCPLNEGKIDFKILYLDADRKPTRGMDVMAASPNVMSCMDGRVVAAVQGQNDWSVIIAHGDYFCVLSNLASCLVKAGENVSTGQLVGTALKRPADEKFVVHIEFWNGINHLWPADWISCQ